MGLHQPNVFPRRLTLGNFDHLVRNRIGKEDYHIRISYQTFKVCFWLRKNLRVTGILFTDALVTADHAIISTYYNDIHKLSISCHRISVG
jgi:hypothetical protein